MNPCVVSQIIFSETYKVPPEQTTQQMFRLLPHGNGYADRMIDAMATGYLVAVLESICAREMQMYLERDEELIVGSSVQCQHRAAPYWAVVNVDGGWSRSASTGRSVPASDEQDCVRGAICFAIVQRSQMKRRCADGCERSSEGSCCGR